MRSLAATCLSLSLAACAFEPAEMEDSIERNVCVEDAECGDAACVDGMCVAMEVEDPLQVMLEITPVRAPNGEASLPIVIDGITVDGTDELEQILPFPRDFEGRIRSEGVPIEAEISFVPVDTVPGLTVDPITASTAARDADDAEDADYSVRLLEGADYHMEVLPTDPMFPPFHRTVTASLDADADISVDYGELAMRRQTFVFADVPDSRTLQVRAYDSDNGDPVSSAAVIEDGEATLLFSPGSMPYRLEVRAEETYDQAAEAGSRDCQRSTGTFPILRVDSEQLEDPQAERIELTLPAPPQLIRFEGTAELCSDAAEQVSVLPITLRTRNVLLGEQGDADPGFIGMFTATADAAKSEANDRYTFCVEVLPGEYDVVVTPPPSTQCALFAETRLVKGPAEGEPASGTLLQLPRAASLAATLKTMDLSPLAGADVDAIALGRSDTILLEEGDVSVTSYNRSGQTVTDEQGEFTLLVDLGSYDVTIKPPVTSGFAWQVRRDVNIGRRGASFSTTIDMASPVAINGELSYGAVAQDTLEGAQIRAFAVVEDAVGDKRAIAIGRADADVEGRFVLLLPPSIREGW